MGDSQSSTSVDFQAKTMGISTSCQIITASCTLENTLYDGIDFDCPGGFAGNFYEPIPGNYDTATNIVNRSANTGIGFATDAQLSNPSRMVNFSDGHATDGAPAGVEGQVMGLLTQNPVYFGTWASGYLNAMTAQTPLQNVSGTGQLDPQIFPNSIADATWILNCSAIIYDISYTFVNGSVHTVQAQQAPPEWGAFFTAPFAWAQIFSQVSLAMGNAANKAVWSANDSTQLANIVSNFLRLEYFPYYFSSYSASD